jgi:resuscitation-promoting factor RpfA
VPLPTPPASDHTRGDAKREPAVHPKPQAPRPAEPVPEPPPAEPLPAPPQPVESAPVAMAEPASSAPAGPVGDVYVVRPGDTLWSIAQRRLGPGAGPAAIARFVDRLWTMNAAALATGSPDLIMPGQRLRIPETG